MGCKGLVSKGFLMAAVGTVALGLVFLGLFSGKALPLGQSFPLRTFCAPSQIPPGVSWLFIGSLDDLPQDLLISPASAGVTVLEENRLSPKAVQVKVEVAAGAVGNLLRLNSPSSNAEDVPSVSLGQSASSLVADANLKETDFENGKVAVGGDFLIYAYLPIQGVNLSALRIYNRSTGAWHTHEIALEKSLLEAEQALPRYDDPNFILVDAFKTLPDTDGNGVYDFQEPPEEKVPVPGQLGVGLVQGENLIDILAFDETGTASWRVLPILTTYEAEER